MGCSSSKMSLLPSQTNINLDTYFFLRGNGQSLNVSSLNANSISTGSIVANAVSTNALDLDGQLLTASPTQLLLNGIPLVTTSNLSSLSDWSLDPAISTVNLAGNNVIGGGYISSANVVANSAAFGQLFAFNAFFLSSYTSTVSSVVDRAELGLFSTISTGVLTGGNVEPSTLWGQPSSYYQDIVSSISSLTSDNIICSTLSAVSFISTPDIEVSTINGAQFGNSSITVEVVGVSSLVANSISSLGAELRTAFVSTIQFRPEFDVDFNFDLSPIGEGIKTGLTRVAVAVGGGLVAVGSGIVTAATMRKNNTTIINNNFEQYGTATQLQFSTLAVSTPSVYRFVSSSSGEGNTVPGVEYFTSTIIPPGSLAIRSIGDPVNPVDPSTVTSSIQSFGQWYLVPISEVEVSTISTFSELYTSSIATSTTRLIGVGANPPIDLQQTAASQFGGIVGGGYSQITGVEFWSRGGPADANVGVYSRGGTNRALYTDSNLTPHNLLYTVDSNAAISSLSVSTINGVPANISSFQDLGTDTLRVSTIDMNGSGFINWDGGASIYETGPNTLFLTAGNATNIDIQPTQITLNEAGTGGTMIFTNNVLTVSEISTNNIQVISNITAATVSSLSVSTNAIASVSSVSFRAQGPGYTLSSIFNLTSTANVAGATSTLTQLNTDFSIGTNDMFCGQIRIQAPPATQQAEIIFTAPDNDIAVFDLASGDQTIRIRGTGLPGTLSTGYILDTGVNRPFFSTINAGTSTAMMSYFPSTTQSTIGISTISIIPPLTYIAAVYDSTTQTVVGANTSTPMKWNTTALNLGGFTVGTSTIQVPVAGVYEHNLSAQFDTTSLGTNAVQFWLTKNGGAVAQTNSIVTVTGQGETLGTISIFDTAAAGDRYGWMFYSADTNMRAEAVAAGATPAVPSIIFNTKRIG
jgi:hypothetical protein